MQPPRSGHFLPSISAALGLSLASASMLGAQEAPQDVVVETKLLAAEGVDGDNFGAALAIEGDVLAVGAPSADLDDADDVDSFGVVYVFLRDQASGEWIQHQRLVPDGGGYEGNFYDMTLAIQGDTIVVGAPFATLQEFQQGAVHVFERDQTGNWAHTAKITDRTVGFGGHFGTSLALEGDLLVVGATQESVDGHGRVGIFERDRGGPDNWGRVTSLYGFNWADPSRSPDDAGNPSGFGSSVALQGDLLLIGAEGTTITPGNGDGAMYLFRRDANDLDRWEYLTRLVRPGAADCVNGLPLSQFYLEATPEEIEAAAECAAESPFRASRFGDQVAVQGDTVVVSAPSAAGEDGSYSVGEVHLYERDPSGGDVWPYVATLTAGDPSSAAYFGSDLLLAGDTLIVAARGETIDSRQYQGAVYVFERDLASDAWNPTEKLVGGDALSFAYFGEALALDGHTRLIGAMGHQAARGAVYLHEPATPEEPEDPCTPSFETTAELSGASVATDPSGAMLGAVAGTVPDTLPVWIHEVAPPAEPLFDDAIPMGAYYNVGAGCATFAPPDAPFVAALPVPEGTDPSSLGVAVLVSAEALLDGPASGRFWQPLSGTYDADHRVYMVTLGKLEEAGDTLVLIQHPDLGPVPLAAARAPGSAFTAPLFLVQCFGFTSGCSLAEEAQVQQKLLDAYVKFNKHEFPPPALANDKPALDANGQFSVQTSPLLYNQILIRSTADPACNVEAGNMAFYAYSPGTGTITFCMDPPGGFPDDDLLAAAATHELFHATQYAFDKVRDESSDNWVKEGTADAAVESDDEMHRFVRRALRTVSARLAHEKGESPPESGYPYETQDFWVHLFRSTNSFGMRRNLDLGELASFLDEGASTESVARYLGDPTDLTFDDLGLEYWAWVKNQVAEKTDVTLDGTLQNPCTIEDGLVNLATEFSYPAVDQVFDSLGPLESELIQITFRDAEDPEGGLGSLRVVAEGAQLKYKVYLVEDYDADPWALEPTCVEIPDGGDDGRGFADLPAGSVVYVLLSRTKHEDEVVEPPLYRVWIDREALPQRQQVGRSRP